jgi:hypothetical protein
MCHHLTRGASQEQKSKPCQTNVPDGQVKQAEQVSFPRAAFTPENAIKSSKSSIILRQLISMKLSLSATLYLNHLLRKVL